MTSMPIQNPAVKPSALAGQENGKVDLSLLEQVDERTGYTWLL